MFAVYAAEPNHEDPLASLRIGDRPDPEVPDGHVAVTVRAASLNMHDLWTLRGVGIKPEQYPMILGCDGAGVLPDGSEVVLHSVIPSPGWMGDETLDPGRKLLTEQLQGTFADIVVVPARNVLPKPASLTFPEAGCLGTAWLTAYRMLFVKSGLRPGQTMLVQGASGGVATALIQLGRAAGMRVWVTGRTDGMRALRPGGVIVVSGSTSGPNPGADLQRLFFLQLSVIGSTMGTRDELASLLTFVTNAGIAPEIGLQVPMEQAAEGFRAMLNGDTAGKIVFTR